MSAVVVVRKVRTSQSATQSNPIMQESQQSIRVLLVDDHEHVLYGMCQLVNGERPRMTVVATARSTKEAREALRQHRFDVVVMDVFLGDEISLAYLPELVEVHGAQLIVLTSLTDVSLYRQASQCGAKAVVQKGESGTVLLREIERVHKLSMNRGAPMAKL